VVLEIHRSYIGIHVWHRVLTTIISAPTLQAAAESIAEGDVVGSRISRTQQWGLAPLQGVLACAKPGWHVSVSVYVHRYIDRYIDGLMDG